jgi:hypothetical protein
MAHNAATGLLYWRQLEYEYAMSFLQSIQGRKREEPTYRIRQ